MKVSPGVWVGAGLGCCSVAATLLTPLSFLPYVTSIVISTTLGAIGLICLFAGMKEYFIQQGRDLERAERPEREVAPVQAPARSLALPLSPGSAASTVDEPAPNLVAHSPRLTFVFVKPNGTFANSGDRFDDQYTAVVAVFSNDPRQDRRVGAALDMRAKIVFGHLTDKPVSSGYWTESEINSIDLYPGATSRELLIAMADREGNVYVVEDRREESNYRLPATWMLLPAATTVDSVEVEVTLTSDEGDFFGSHAYSLRTRGQLRLELL